MARKRRSRASVHAALLRRAHTDGTYERLYEKQGGLCGICRKPNNADRRFDIDHCHRTLKIRGLLHRGCNMRLRKDMTADWMRQAADYLDSVDTDPPAL